MCKGGGVEVPDQVNAMHECGRAQPWTDRQSLLWVRERTRYRGRKWPGLAVSQEDIKRVD
jgi:hypothetical protein